MDLELSKALSTQGVFYNILFFSVANLVSRNVSKGRV